MPTLPSGRVLALSMHHILEPGVQMFSCPEGHYWYQEPDRALNAPPFQRDMDVLCDFVHAPCPTTREEALKILHVYEVYGKDEQTTYHWPGYKAGDPEAFAELTPEDRAAWDEWVATPRTQQFLDTVIDKCRQQAEANRKSPGYMVFRSPARNGTAKDAAEHARQQATAHGVTLANVALQLESDLENARAHRDEVEGKRIFDALHDLLRELDEVVDDPARAVPEAWHARGIVTRLLQRPEEAERCFLEAVRNAPFSLDSWSELTRIRGEQGKLQEAEVAARKAVECGKKSARAWANLAAVLIAMGRKDEAREAAGRSLEIDEGDEVGRRVRRESGGG